MEAAAPAPSITEVIPRTGLFPSYVARAQRITDAPAIYHVGALLACLSSVLGDKARLSFRSGAQSRLEPMQLWVMLCGKSNNRKSHALDLCTGANPRFTGALAPWLQERLCPDSGTREGFEQFMIRKPNAFLAIREMPTWLADNRTVWMRNGAAWWCKIFDGMLEPKLLGAAGDGTDHNTKRAYEVNIGVCAAGETTGVLAASRPTDFSGGMFSRMLWLSAGKRQERHEWFDWGDSDLKSIRSSVRSLQSMCARSPGITISRDAWAIYRRWNDDLQGSLENLGLSYSTVLGRLGRHIKVVAGIYALSCGKTEVDDEIMSCAVSLGRSSHRSVLEVPMP